MPAICQACGANSNPALSCPHCGKCIQPQIITQAQTGPDGTHQLESLQPPTHKPQTFSPIPRLKNVHIAAVAIIILAGTFILMSLISDPPSTTPATVTSMAQPSLYTNLIAMTTRADQLLLAGHRVKAINAYQGILDLTASFPTSDPLTESIITSAHQNIARLHNVRATPQPQPPVAIAPISPSKKTQALFSPPEQPKPQSRIVVTAIPAAQSSIATPEIQPAPRESAPALSQELPPAQTLFPPSTLGDFNPDSVLPDSNFQTPIAGDQFRPHPQLRPKNQQWQVGKPGYVYSSWIAEMFGPPTSQTWTFTEGGHTYTLGGLHGPRSASGHFTTWSGAVNFLPPSN